METQHVYFQLATEFVYLY